MHKLRWRLACLFNRLAWEIMPEPQRSRMARDFHEVHERNKKCSSQP